MFHSKVIEKVRLSLTKKIDKLDEKKECYCFPSNYAFEMCSDELYIYKVFEKVLNKLEKGENIDV